jgi:molecular chaperone DnaJ
MAAQREWFEKDYYSILGVATNAAPKDITKAYRKLARELHPDANPGNPAAEERFKEVAAAYDVLGDETKRSEYDQVRSMSGPKGGFGGFDGGGMGGTFDPDDLSGLFGNLFGAANAGRASGPRRGDDLEAALEISFYDAVHGMTATVGLTADALCPTCAGSGCAAGTGRTVCVACGGQGTATSNQGLFSFAKPCATCGGQGNVPQSPCGTCHGSGVARIPQEIKARIPAGVDTGKQIRLKGKGGPGRFGAPNGDLYINVTVTSDPVFGRDGDHVTLTLPVTFTEATLGANVRIPTPSGAPLTITIPAGCASGKTLRVKGHGVQNKKGSGDLLVAVQVVVPTDLDDKQRAAIEALQDMFPANVRTGPLDV